YIEVFSDIGFYADSYSITINAPAEAPRVTGVFARGSAWSQSLLDYLQANGMGSSEYGYAIPDGLGQLRDLPWSNIDEIALTFSEPIEASAISAALISGRLE